MGQASSTEWHEHQASNPEIEDLESGVKTVVLIHGLASCALRGRTSGAGFLCDHFHQACCPGENPERLLYVSISELTKRPHIVKSLALSWEDSVTRHQDGKPQRTFKTTDGYENATVYPVEGLDGIRTLNPGIESDVAPVYLWHTIIEHLSDYNLLAFNYDWRRWGDVIYIAQLVPKFRELFETALRVSGQPTVVVAHSLGAQVITYMMGLLGPDWTEAHISDVVLVGPATMGSPSVYAGYANGPSTLTHSSAVPVVEFMETRFRDVASTWPGMLAVLPTPLDGLNTHGPEPMAIAPKKSYGGMDSVAFLEDLAKSDDEVIKNMMNDEKRGIHEMTRHFLEEHEILDVKRVWGTQFQNAAVMRRAFEAHVAPYLKPPKCRVHVIYTDAIPTLYTQNFKENLYEKAKFGKNVGGDDTITAASVDRMCQAWKEAGVEVKKHHAGKHHHKDLIMCPFTMKVMDSIMSDPFGDQMGSSESESEAEACGTCG